MGLFDEDQDSLDGLLLDDNLDDYTRNQAKQIQSLESDLRGAGLTPPPSEPRHSIFLDILDTLDAPRQGIAGVIDTLFRGDAFQVDPLTGQNIGIGFRRGQKENTTFSDILRRNDVIENPILRGTAGFIGDVFTDPLTYLTFGAGTGAKVGGRVLTEKGLELRNSLSKKLTDNGVVDILEHSEKIDNAFVSIAKLQEATKSLSNTSSDSVRAFNKSQVDKFEKELAGLVDTNDIANANIFEKSKIKVGINVPFLGNFTKSDEAKLATEIVYQDPGPIGSALRAAGKVFNPKKINIADIEISDKVIDAFDNLRLYANEKLDTIKTLPVIGAPVKLATDAADKASILFSKVFNQKALTGADFNRNRLNYIDYREASKAQALQRTTEILGDDILRDKNIQKEVFLALDAQAFDSIKDAATKGGNEDILNIINKLKAGADVSESDMMAFKALSTQSGSEQVFRERLNNLLASNIDPKVKEGLIKTVKAMDDIAAEEAQLGIKHGFIDYYVPHRYKRLGELETSTSSNKSFIKGRKYSTIGEAFEQSGKVADTDLAALLQSRIQKSLELQAQRRFAQRVMIEESLPKDLMVQVYREAQQIPGGEASKLLKRYGINLKPIDPELMKDGAYNAIRQRIYRGVGLKDPQASELAAKSTAEFQAKVNEELWSSGKKPLDNMIPQEALGELGDAVKLPGSSDEFFLPKPVADAFKETIANKDILKDALKGSSFGKATLNMLDSASSFFRRWVTLPWPGYWAQNFFGDRFNQAMAGIQAYDPGIFARTHSVLNGKSAVKTPSGQLINKSGLDNIIKQFGVNYSVNDYLGTVESLGKMNIDSFLAQKNTLLDNVTKAKNAANRIAARNQVADKFQKTFDGFFRVSHVVHRLEKGDSVADAVRGAQDLYFNYRDMSDVEKSLFRRFYMFYGYLSKATKRSVNSLMTAPGNITQQLHGTRALAEFFSSPDASPSVDQIENKLLSSATRSEQLSHYVGRSEDGKPIYARGFAAPINAVLQQFTAYAPRNLSVDELIDSTGDSFRRTIQKQFATSNPIINSIAQVVSGKNLYFDKPLDSAFLRKLPSLNSAVERLAGIPYDKLPVDLDAPVKAFLNAVPDGKGRLIADQGRMWVLMNLVPGLSRLVSTAGSITNTDTPTKLGLFRALTGVNIEDTDPSRTFISSRLDELKDFAKSNSLSQRKRNAEEGIDG